MAYSYHRGPSSLRVGTVTVALVALNILVFLFSFVDRRGNVGYLALVPDYVVSAGAWWQLATYMFVHVQFTHLLFNMLALVLFGTALEARMGARDFLFFYLACGVGVGLATLGFNLAGSIGNVPVIGASGAVFGLLLAYAAFNPFDRIYVMGLIPLRAPVAVGVFAALELVLQLSNLRTGVAHIAHLSGIVVAFVYLLLRWRINALTVFFRRR